MAREHDDLRRLIDDLDARLGRLEERLGLPRAAGAVRGEAGAASGEGPVAAAPPVAPPIAAIAVEETALIAEPAQVAVPAGVSAEPTAAPPAPVSPPVASRTGPVVLEDLVRRRAQGHGSRAAETAGSLSMPPPQRPTPRKADAGSSFEMFLGARFAAAFGALVFVIGVALGLKYGLDRGWFRFPPSLRVLGCAGVGVGLIGVGEVVRRKLGPSGATASAALGAAGLTIVYAAGYAAYALYGLVPMSLDFVLLALISAGGIGLALMTGSLAMGTLALAGAYLNPLLMGQRGPSPLVGPAYLTALLVLGLGLAGWRPRPFRPLRGVAGWGTVLCGSVVLGTMAHAHPLIVIAFAGPWWALVHVELVLGARRLPQGEAVAGSARSLSRRLSGPSLASLGMTLWSAGAGLVAIEASDVPVPGLEEWMVTGGWMVATAVPALILAGNLRVMRDAPSTDAERLGVMLWAQSAALLVATVALGLAGVSQTVAWIAMGLAVVAAGRWSRAAAIDAYGLVLLGIAALRLVLWDSWHAAGSGAAAVAGVPVDAWTALMLLGGAAWVGAAAMLRRSGALEEDGTPGVGGGWESQRRAGAVAASAAVGLTLVCGSVVREGTPPAALAIAPAVLCGLVSVAAWLRRSGGLGVYAFLALLGSLAIWAGVYVAPGWSDEPAAGAGVFAHPGLWVGLLVATLGGCSAAAYLRPAAWRERAWSLGAALGWSVGALALAATSLEIARSASIMASDRAVRGAAVSGWWGVLGVAMVAAGFVGTRPSLRWVGLGLLGAASVKAVLLDLADVSQGWRIVSFIVLGLLMLGVAVGYAKVARRLAAG
jgi:uncharacterized membrane protein